MTRLVLVRHGESNVTVDRVIGGPRTCSGLSPLGVQQADRLRERWAATQEFTADLLLASQYPRAIETADIVAPSLGGLGVLRDDDFGEHDPGTECDGLTYKQYMALYDIGPEAWDAADPFATTFPGGETVAAFQFRVGSALRRTLDLYEGQTVVVVCHGGVVDAILRLALKAPGMGAFEIHTLNASITEMLLVKRNTWRLVRYNDTAHLAGLAAQTNPPFADRA